MGNHFCAIHGDDSSHAKSQRSGDRSFCHFCGPLGNSVIISKRMERIDPINPHEILLPEYYRRTITSLNVHNTARRSEMLSYNFYSFPTRLQPIRPPSSLNDASGFTLSISIDNLESIQRFAVMQDLDYCLGRSFVTSELFGDLKIGQTSSSTPPSVCIDKTLKPYMITCFVSQTLQELVTPNPIEIIRDTFHIAIFGKKRWIR